MLWPPGYLSALLNYSSTDHGDQTANGRKLCFFAPSRGRTTTYEADTGFVNDYFWTRMSKIPSMAQEISVRLQTVDRDRKSTRLNSSYARRSYAVVCLEEKMR
mgnify:CR=1 FL=1